MKGFQFKLAVVHTVLQAMIYVGLGASGAPAAPWAALFAMVVGTMLGYFAGEERGREQSR